jgi:xanthine dehydrogenase accessory factor
MSDKRIYEEIVKIHQTGGTAALVTVVGTEGSTPRKAGAKMIVWPDGRTVGTIGGGCIDRRIYSEVARVFQEGRPRLCRYELDGEIAAEMGMICGGRMEVFVERIDAEPRVVLFGGGHVGKTLAHLCTLVGFKVTVVDDREEFAKPERFPDAHEVVLESFDRAGERVGRHGAPFVVVVTRGHAHDQEVLVQVLRENTRYVGVLGSKHKIVTLFQALVKAGIPEERVAEVHSPIGLDLGAQTPEEIALAIAAELVAMRYGRAGGPLCDTRDAPRGRPIPDDEDVPEGTETAGTTPEARAVTSRPPREARAFTSCGPGCCPSADDPPEGVDR